MGCGWHGRHASPGQGRTLDLFIRSNPRPHPRLNPEAAQPQFEPVSLALFSRRRAEGHIREAGVYPTIRVRMCPCRREAPASPTQHQI